MSKVSIRFFNDREVRAIWDEENEKWWFSVLDIIGVLNDQSNYEKNRNYWKYLKAKLKNENSQLVSATTQLKLTAAAEFLPQTLENIEKMREATFEEIADKYVEMNIAHPFREGNGRTARIWLDLILKKQLKKCVDWSRINKKDYLDAMEESVMDSSKIKKLLYEALTDKINNREMFMKGIDYSYYYEEIDNK